MYRATVDARVQITGRARDLNRVVRNAAEAIGDAGLVLAKPVVVADAHHVRVLEEAVLFLLDKLVQAVGSTLCLKKKKNSFFVCYKKRGKKDVPSMPSKMKRRLTGKSMPSCWCASTTQSHAITGPLSSVEPRPRRRPLISVSSNGSVSQPSDLYAG